MKYLIVCLDSYGLESPIYIAASLDAAIHYIKDHFSHYVMTKSFRIYTLDKFVSAKYLDNKIFID